MLRRNTDEKNSVAFHILNFCIYIISSRAKLAYSFVVWNGNVYEVTDEMVLENDIGDYIGEVKTIPNDMTGDYYGNASNAFPKGTKYFKINDLSTKTAIAVKVEENQWQKAVYVHKAPFHWMDFFTKVLPIFILIGVVLLFVFHFIKKKN